MTGRSFAFLQPAPDEVGEVAAAIADEVAPKSVSTTKNARTMLISQDSLPFRPPPFFFANGGKLMWINFPAPEKFIVPTMPRHLRCRFFF